MKKKIATLLLGSLLSISLIACGSKETPVTEVVTEEVTEETEESTEETLEEAVEETEESTEAVIDTSDAVSILSNVKNPDNYTSNIEAYMSYESSNASSKLMEIEMQYLTANGIVANSGKVNVFGMEVPVDSYYDNNTGRKYELVTTMVNEEEVTKWKYSEDSETSDTSDLGVTSISDEFTGALVVEDDEMYTITKDIDSNSTALDIFGGVRDSLSDGESDEVVYTMTLKVNKKDLTLESIAAEAIIEDEENTDGAYSVMSLKMTFYDYGTTVVEIPEDVLTTAELSE